MRVLHVVPSLEVGGAERIVVNLARHHARGGHDVGVVSMYGERGTWLERALRAERVEMFFLGKRAGIDLRMIPRMALAQARFRPQVLHTHLYVLHYALPACWMSTRCRVVHTMHTGAEREVEGLARLVERLGFRTGVVPVAIGDAVARSMRRVYGISPRRVIPNGIPVAEYEGLAGDRAQVRASLAIPGDAPVFVCVGRFWEVKNHRGLIRAFASRRLASLGARLLLAGDGELRRELEQQVQDLGVSERVHLLGVRPDVPRVLAAADVFVLASSAEGNPLSVMEAMAAGKPIVATAVGCIPELVTEGTGRLVPAGAEAALESAMYELANDLPLAVVMGGAARCAARERFDDGHMASAYERLYAEVA